MEIFLRVTWCSCGIRCCSGPDHSLTAELRPAGGRRRSAGGGWQQLMNRWLIAWNKRWQEIQSWVNTNKYKAWESSDGEVGKVLETSWLAGRWSPCDAHRRQRCHDAGRQDGCGRPVALTRTSHTPVETQLLFRSIRPPSHSIEPMTSSDGPPLWSRLQEGRWRQLLVCSDIQMLDSISHT